MSIHNFVVAESKSGVRIHRTTCKKLAASTSSPVTLEAYLVNRDEWQPPAATPASCCKPNGARIYLDATLAELAEMVKREVAPELPQAAAAEFEARAEAVQEAFEGEPAASEAIVEKLVEDGVFESATAEPEVEETAAAPIEGQHTATYLGPKYLWRAAGKLGVPAFLNGDPVGFKVNADYTVTLHDEEVAHQLEEAWVGAVRALKVWRKTDEAKALPAYGAKWATSPRYAAEEQVIVDFLAGK